MSEIREKIKQIASFFVEMSRQGKISYLSSGIKLALENYKRANSALWVTSLCYFTLLSMAPMMAIIFGLCNWMGMGDYLLNKLKNNSPLNDETIQTIMGFADRLLDNARNGVLAGIGFIFLGWTLISMFSVVEKAFNDIWQVKKSRVILRKITDYFSFIIFTPVFIVAINGVSVILSRRLKGYLAFYLSNLIPYLAILIFFTALYMLMPNTRVKFVPAFLSAVIISVLCMIFQNIFFYVQGRINTYNKIYGSFATVFIFIYWLKILWFFIILGGHFSYFLQNKRLHNANSKARTNYNFRTKEYIGIMLMLEFIKRYKNNMPPVSGDILAETTNLPLDAVNTVLEVLKEEKIIAEINDNDEDCDYFIIRNVDTFTCGDLFKTLESNGKEIEIEEKPKNYKKINEIIEKKSLNVKLVDMI